MNSKKGMTLNDVPMIAMVFVTIAIILGVSATVLTNMQASDLMTGSASASISTTALVDNATAQDFDTFTDFYGGKALGCSNINVYNATNAANITASFTFDATECTMLLTLYDVSINGTSAQVNYTRSYTTYFTNYNNSQDGLNATSDLSGWQSTWVVVLAAGIILFIIGRYLFFK